MAEYKGVLVYLEASGGKLTIMDTELLGAGRLLARELGQGMSAVLIGATVSSLAQEAIAYGADRVYIVEDSLQQIYLTDSYPRAMEKVITQAMPQVILMGQTHTGRDLAPRLAFKLNTTATLDCTALSVNTESKRVLMTKPIYGGNAQVIQVCESDPQIATVRRKAISPLIRDSDRKGEIINVAVEIDPASVKTRILERKVEATAGIKLEDARVVVTGGRGIGGPEGFKQLDELARICKGAVGASRPACDNKWVSGSLQVGLTGKIVSPELYIAIALSGSSQHLSGCSAAKVIVAINKDSEANIINVANYGVVGDWKKILPSFTNELKELLSV